MSTPLQDAPPTPPPAPARSRWRGVALAVAGLAVGIGATAGVSALRGGDDGAPALPAGNGAALPDLKARAAAQGPRVRAAGPAEAVRRFLDAERAGDRAASFALLSDAVRAEYTTAAAWAGDHPDVLPPVTGYTVETDPGAVAAPRADVVTTTTYVSNLDTVAGLVPARARTTWVAVQEDDGWAVDVDDTTQEPLLPPDATAVPVAQAWVDAQQRCATPPTYGGALRGEPSAAVPLCGATGAERAGAPGPLPQLDARGLQTAYGGDVTTWARVVPVDGAVRLRLVLAPVDDRWVVVAALPAR